MTDNSPPTPDTERRERWAAPLFAIMRENGWDGIRSDRVDREMDMVVNAAMAVADEELRDQRDRRAAQAIALFQRYADRGAENERLRAELDRFVETARGIVADYDTDQWSSAKDEVNELRYVLEVPLHDALEEPTAPAGPLPETGRPPPGAPPYIPEVDDPDDEHPTALTPEREQDIRDREQAATPGTWGIYFDGVVYDVASQIKLTDTGFQCRRQITELRDEPIDNDPAHRDWTAEEDATQIFRDATFIARARDDIPALLAELDRVRAERDALRVRVEELMQQRDDLLVEDALAEMQRANGNPIGGA